MAKVTTSSVTVELTEQEMDTIRTGLRHTVQYGTVAEEDKAMTLLEDLNGGSR